MNEPIAICLYTKHCYYKRHLSKFQHALCAFDDSCNRQVVVTGGGSALMVYEKRRLGDEEIRTREKW
jgi:hypothetical protein